MRVTFLFPTIYRKRQRTLTPAALEAAEQAPQRKRATKQ